MEETMIHDNLKDRMEYIDWLKAKGAYNPMASAQQMQIGHTAYWMEKDRNTKENSK
jgi:hypothetical protein